jgi:hypothetical protein
MAIALHGVRGVYSKRGEGSFPVTTGEAAFYGIGDRWRRNSISRIEAAGLLKAEHAAGKAPRVTILEVDEDEE